MPDFDLLTTRMPKGLTNAAPWQTMGAAGIPDPTWAQRYDNDFNTYIATDFTNSLVGAGTSALTPGDGGQLLITTSAGAADAVFMQLTTATFKNTPGKQLFFKFAGTLSDVINDVFYAGLIITSATPLTAANGIFIRKATGAALLTLVAKVGGVEVTVNFPANQIPVNGVQFEIGFMVDAKGNVAAFFNPTTGNNPISAAAAASTQARGYVCKLAVPPLPAAILAPSFGLLNSTAVARTLTVDYVVVARER